MSVCIPLSWIRKINKLSSTDIDRESRANRVHRRDLFYRPHHGKRKRFFLFFFKLLKEINDCIIICLNLVFARMTVNKLLSELKHFITIESVHLEGYSDTLSTGVCIVSHSSVFRVMCVEVFEFSFLIKLRVMMLEYLIPR